MAVFDDEAAFGLVREQRLSQTRHHCRVGQPGDEGQGQEHEASGTQGAYDVAEHGSTSLCQAAGGQRHVDELDADKGGDQTAAAIEDEVVAQDRRRPAAL